MLLRTHWSVRHYSKGSVHLWATTAITVVAQWESMARTYQRTASVLLSTNGIVCCALGLRI